MILQGLYCFGHLMSDHLWRNKHGYVTSSGYSAKNIEWKLSNLTINHHIISKMKLVLFSISHVKYFWRNFFESDWLTGRWTDRLTDRPTNKVTYRSMGLPRLTSMFCASVNRSTKIDKPQWLRRLGYAISLRCSSEEWKLLELIFY